MDDQLVQDQQPQEVAEDGSQYQVVPLDEVRALVDGVATQAANQAAYEVGASLSEVVGTGLSPEQYDGLREMMSAQLHGEVFAGGALALIVGLLVSLVVTIHWRAR